MGILDEAIREHLELKRQHGAEDSELKQLEDEAFGPPERPGVEAEPSASDLAAAAPTEFMPQAQAPEAEGPPAPPPEAVEPEAAQPEPAHEEEPAAEHQIVTEPPVAEPPVAEPPVAEPPVAEPPVTERPTELYDVAAEEDFFDEQSLSDELDQALEGGEESAPEPEPESAQEPVEAEQELFEEEVEGEEEVEAEEEEEAEEEAGFRDQEDVLEETPEFLQDTPESDRLWFEQKPPKDFDFDD
jgi:hypothetical protein